MSALFFTGAAQSYDTHVLESHLRPHDQTFFATIVEEFELLGIGILKQNIENLHQEIEGLQEEIGDLKKSHEELT